MTSLVPTLVAAEIGNGLLGTANLAEVIGKMVDAGPDVSRLRELLAAARCDDRTRSSKRTPNSPVPFAREAAAKRPLLPRSDGTQPAARSVDC
jgi:hypothetical protein